MSGNGDILGVSQECHRILSLVFYFVGAVTGSHGQEDQGEGLWLS